jgi:Tfp pilus assembly protein PilV
MRRGFTTTEIMVACSLLVGSMAIVGPLAARTTRLWQDSRHQQLALQELASELERLTALDSKDRTVAMESLTPSASLAAAAPNAEVVAEIVTDGDGTRMILTLHWNQSDQPRAPLRLVGWLAPLPPEDES